MLAGSRCGVHLDRRSSQGKPGKPRGLRTVAAGKRAPSLSNYERACGVFAPAVTERPRFNMANVAHAFQAFLSDLELTEREREVATSQHITVRSNLQASLDGVETALLMGSFRRRTAIRPLGDIDVFAVLDPAVHAGARSRSPIELLQAVDRALRRSYPNHRPRIQGRSVNIEFTGTGIGYDIVPAFASGRARDSDGQPAEFEIPDRAQRA